VFLSMHKLICISPTCTATVCWDYLHQAHSALAYDDSRAGQFDRAVVCPALAVPEFVKRLTIQFLSLQCCDMLHVHAELPQCHLGI
jgi:hypothetical protein